MKNIEDFDEIPEELILTNCKPYMELLSHLSQKGVKKPLLRGTNHYAEELTRVAFSQRHGPVSMDEDIHAIAGGWFKDEFGFNARMESYFATTSYGMAHGYGITHFIFPIGKFSTVHSPIVQDLYQTINPTKIAGYAKKMYGLSEAPDGYKKIDVYLIENDYQKFKNIIREILQDSKYVKNNYEDAFQSGHELMIKSNAYYKIAADNQPMKEFINDFIWDNF